MRLADPGQLGKSTHSAPSRTGRTQSWDESEALRVVSESESTPPPSQLLIKKQTTTTTNNKKETVGGSSKREGVKDHVRNCLPVTLCTLNVVGLAYS